MVIIVAAFSITKQITALLLIALGSAVLPITIYYQSPTVKITADESKHLFPVVTNVGA